MTTSDPAYAEAYVWTWLPEGTAPVVAGRLSWQGDQLLFNYGRSYLSRGDRIPLYLPELPLQEGLIPLPPGLHMPGCIRDASPDAWGRRVLINRKLGLAGVAAAGIELDELTYLLESGSDRIGALDFQHSPRRYEARHAQPASLSELAAAADLVERGVPLSPALGQALQHGTALGGARPKALVEDGQRQYIAKFSSSTDYYNVVKGEYIAMRLAHLAGLDVAPVRLETSLGKDVLLVERFDRTWREGHWHRRAMVSALTMLELDEMLAAYASYEDLAERIRHRFADARDTARELFGRIVFNILCGNTDDHARNHAAFWDGHQLRLTPAYDLCPQPRTGQEATQAMLIRGRDRRSQVVACIEAAPLYLVAREEAIALVNHQVKVIVSSWDEVCDEAGLSEVDRASFWRRQFLNPYAFHDAPEGIAVPGDAVRS